METERHIFGRFQFDLTFHEVNKKELCCTVQNPFVSYKHEKTFLDESKEKIIRKIDRQIKDWRKEFFKREK